MFVFVAWFCFGVAVVNKVEKGLDQNLSMPKVRQNKKSKKQIASESFKTLTLY